jgi:hypothetical protein
MIDHTERAAALSTKNSLRTTLYMKNESIEINLSEKYSLTNIDGMTIHTLLTALADAERMYKKVGMTGLAENAANAYKVILASIRDSRWTKC